MALEIEIESPGWSGVDLPALAERAARAALACHGLALEGCDISLLATDDARIAELNGTYRGKPRPTNVLSWPAQDIAAGVEGGTPAPPLADAFGDVPLGDVALAWETCLREADEMGKPLADHVTHLVVHGVLHLLGYDHVRDADATMMETLEAEILGKLGLDDPYKA